MDKQAAFWKRSNWKVVMVDNKPGIEVPNFSFLLLHILRSWIIPVVIDRWASGI